MRTKESKNVNPEVLTLKQASITRALQAAREAMERGELRVIGRSASLSYARELRVNPT